MLGGLLIAGATVGPATHAGAAPPVDSIQKRLPGKLRPQWVKGELLVKFREGVRRSEAREAHALRGARLTSRIRGSGIDVVKLPPGESVPEAVAAYQADPLVAVAEPNLRRELFQVIPNDPSFPDQWGLWNTGQAHSIADPDPPGQTAAGTADADADVADAWAIQDGDPSTVIAILDSGIDVTHPDLDGNLWVNPGDATVDGVDNDANGYVDDVNGCDFTDRVCPPLMMLDPPDPNLNYGHGTHVAGIAAAEYNNSTGVAGVCPQCRIMALKVGDAFGLNLDAELQAFDYARKMGADIVNVSFGGAIWSKLERDAIAALDAAGVLVVAAAGNAALDNDLAIDSNFGASPSFPSSYTLPNILAVAASNHHDQYGYFTGCAIRALPDCLFTHWGHDSVDVAGPGVDMLSTFPGGYINFNGTSMAAPFVAGVAGLVKSQNPLYNGAELKNAIMNTADHPVALDTLNLLGKIRGGAFTRTADGRVNALAALTGSTANATVLTDGNIDGARRMKSIKKGSVRWPDDVNDVFKRFLKRGTYRVFLDGPKGKDFDLYVWKRRTTEIWQYETACLGGPSGQCKLMRARAGPTADEEIKKLKIKKKGVYFFHVSAFLFSKGKYKLSIKKL